MSEQEIRESDRNKTGWTHQRTTCDVLHRVKLPSGLILRLQLNCLRKDLTSISQEKTANCQRELQDGGRMCQCGQRSCRLWALWSGAHILLLDVLAIYIMNPSYTCLHLWFRMTKGQGSHLWLDSVKPSSDYAIFSHHLARNLPGKQSLTDHVRLPAWNNFHLIQYLITE